LILRPASDNPQIVRPVTVLWLSTEFNLSTAVCEQPKRPIH